MRLNEKHEYTIFGIYVSSWGNGKIGEIKYYPDNYKATIFYI